MMPLNDRPPRILAPALLFVWGLSILGSLPVASADNEIFSVQSRASTPNFQLFLNLADDSTVTTTGPLFVLNGIFGLTALDGTIYAAELDGPTSDEYLATIPTSSGVGARVSANSIGFANVESLAAADGILYGTSFDFSAPHLTTLITIDPVTGVGSAIGVGDPDVFIVGLAFDPTADILYGAGIPWGDPVTGVLTPNLYTLDRGTGDTTLVGDLGVELQSLAWDAELGLIGAFDHLYDIDTGTGAATQIGSTDFTDGIPSAFNGLYSLAAIVEATASVDGDYNEDGKVDAADYTRWRDNLGSSITLPNDTTPGSVTSVDYDVWKANFGAMSGSGALANASGGSDSVPEPGTLFLALTALAGEWLSRKRQLTRR